MACYVARLPILRPQPVRTLATPSWAYSVLPPAAALQARLAAGCGRCWGRALLGTHPPAAPCLCPGRRTCRSAAGAAAAVAGSRRRRCIRRHNLLGSLLRCGRSSRQAGGLGRAAALARAPAAAAFGCLGKGRQRRGQCRKRAGGRRRDGRSRPGCSPWLPAGAGAAGAAPVGQAAGRAAPAPAGGTAAAASAAAGPHCQRPVGAAATRCGASWRGSCSSRSPGAAGSDARLAAACGATAGTSSGHQCRPCSAAASRKRLQQHAAVVRCSLRLRRAGQQLGCGSGCRTGREGRHCCCCNSSGCCSISHSGSRTLPQPTAGSRRCGAAAAAAPRHRCCSSAVGRPRQPQAAGVAACSCCRHTLGTAYW